MGMNKVKDGHCQTRLFKYQLKFQSGTKGYCLTETTAMFLFNARGGHAFSPSMINR